MIVTVTPNAALDITYVVDALAPSCTHHVRSVRERGGGKGVNVASVAMRMGYDACAIGIAGGSNGERLLADLRERALPHRFVERPWETRRTVTLAVGPSAEATIFLEPGHAVDEPTWDELLVTVEDLLSAPAVHSHRGVAVCSGSLPPGSEPDLPARVVAIARNIGAASIVDTSGAALLASLGAEPDLVKPNRREAAEATGCSDVSGAALALQALGARDVLISDGSRGLTLVPRSGGGVHAVLDHELAGNATGAGDALTAALAAALAAGTFDDLEATLRSAVAWSAAAVLSPVAGDIDPDDVERLLPHVRLSRP